MPLKPVPQFSKSGRNVRLSYVPEEIREPKYSVRDWANEFAKSLRVAGLGAALEDLAGTHELDSSLSGSVSDLVVVFTTDYALNIPYAVRQLLESMQDDGDGADVPGMWLARYDMDGYDRTALGTSRLWHVLSGTGPGGARFKKIDDVPDAQGSWKDDLARAVRIILEPEPVDEHTFCAICKLARLGRP